jgi:hypothetical protein
LLTIFKVENVTGTHFLRGGFKSRELQPIKSRGKVNMKILKYMIVAHSETKPKILYFGQILVFYYVTGTLFPYILQTPLPVYKMK